MKHSKDKALLETPELHISPVNIVDYLQHVPDVVLRVYGEHHSHYVVVPKHEELTVVVLEVVLHDYVGLDHGFAAEMGSRRDPAGAALADERTRDFFKAHLT